MRNLHTEDNSCTTSQNKLLHGKHKHVIQVQQSLSQFCNSLGSKTSNSSLILIGSSIPPYTINQSLNKIKESTNQMTSQDTCASNFISLIGAFRSSSYNLISGHSNWSFYMSYVFDRSVRSDRNCRFISKNSRFQPYFAKQ